MEYDLHGNLVKAIDAHSSETLIERNSIGLISSITDPLGHITRLFYDSSGNLERTLDPLGHETAFARDAAGNLQTKTDASGAVTSFEYCIMNKLVTLINAEGNTTRLSYEPSSCSGCGGEDQITSITDPKGNITRMDYDQLGRLLKVTDALSNISSNTFDLAGRLQKVTDALGKSVRFVRDPRGLPVESIRPDNVKNTFEYDAVANLVRAKAAADTPDEVATTYGHDLLGHVIMSTVAAGTPDEASTLFEFDINGNLVKRTNAKGASWVWEYDELNRLIAKRDALGRERRYLYNARSERTDVIDAKGQRAHYSYNPNGWLTKVEYFDDTATKVSEVNLTHDDVGNVLSVADGTTSISQTFDLLRRVTQREFVNLGRTVTYAYNENGSRSSAIFNGSRPLVYFYDQLNRLTRMGSPEGNTDYAYDAVSKRTSVTYPNGIIKNYAYDEIYRLTELSYIAPGNANLAFFRYTHDLRGNPLTMEDKEGISTFAYDKQSRLTRAAYPDSSWEEFGYDLVGNRSSLTTPQGTKNSVFDIADQCLGDGDKSYTYDLNGSQISSTDLATSQITNFQFNVRNRLNRVDFPDGTNNTMNYYPLSSLRRSLTTKSGDTTKYFWEGGNVAEEMAADNSHKCWYLEGLGLDAHIAHVSSAGTNYYVRDPLNTVRQVVSQAGVTQNSYTYKAFGQVRDAQETVTNPYRFTGRRWEPDTKLHYFRARYFSGSGGRFIATDAFAPWEHTYGYGNGSPYRFVDPWGRQSSTMEDLAVMVPLLFLAISPLNPYSPFSPSFRGCPPVGKSLADTFAKGPPPIIRPHERKRPRPAAPRKDPKSLDSGPPKLLPGSKDPPEWKPPEIEKWVRYVIFVLTMTNQFGGGQ